MLMRVCSYLVVVVVHDKDIGKCTIAEGNYSYLVESTSAVSLSVSKGRNSKADDGIA